MIVEVTVNQLSEVFSVGPHGCDRHCCSVGLDHSMVALNHGPMCVSPRLSDGVDDVVPRDTLLEVSLKLRPRVVVHYLNLVSLWPPRCCD